MKISERSVNQFIVKPHLKFEVFTEIRVLIQAI